MSSDIRIQCLQKYDDLNKTELVPTLIQYFKCNRELKDTANSLFIHRNTLTKRIERIESLVAIDFNNADEMFKLEYSFRIMEYTKCKQELHTKAV